MDRNNLDKEDKIIFDCYTELYENSVPSVNFNELVKEAKLNENNQKEIPFMDYEIEEELYNKIVEKYSKKFKGYRSQLFKNTIILGCSPKFKK